MILDFRTIQVWGVESLLRKLGLSSQQSLTADEKDALTGSSGAPSINNRFVTETGAAAHEHEISAVIDLEDRLQLIEHDIGGSAFRASTSGLQSITQNTPTKVQADTNTFTPIGNYDTTLFRFTPRSGIYCFSARAQYSGLNDGDQIVAAIYKNGALMTDNGVKIGAGGGNSVLIVDTDFANGVDYYEFFTSHNSSAPRNLAVGSNWTSFRAVRTTVT